MKSSEFIRVFGLNIARIAVEECPSEYELDTVELKRLIESHELVKNHKGISPCKFWVSMMDGCDAYQNKVDLFKQAIEDVESCQ